MTASECLSNNLRTLRIKAGLTQKQLGEIVGYSEKTVSKWELGECTPSLDTVRDLANTLGTDVNALLGFTSSVSALLGISGGGNKTDFVLTDLQGNIISETTLISNKSMDIGIDELKNILRKGITTVMRSIPAGNIACFAGLSSGTTGDNQAEISLLLGTFGFAIYNNGGDAENAVVMALGERDGIVSLIDTGSITYAVLNGKRHRVGGFNYLFDEGGSEYDIGAAAIRAALREEDGSGETTLLHQLISEKLGSSVVANLGRFYEGGKSYIASFAPFVFEAYKKEDSVAKQILERSTQALGHQLITAARKFGNRPVTAWLIGSLVEEREILAPLIESAVSSYPRLTIAVCDKRPVFGALLLAGQLAKKKDTL